MQVEGPFGKVMGESRVRDADNCSMMLASGWEEIQQEEEERSRENQNFHEL